MHLPSLQETQTAAVLLFTFSTADSRCAVKREREKIERERVSPAYSQQQQNPSEVMDATAIASDGEPPSQVEQSVQPSVKLKRKDAKRGGKDCIAPVDG